ncbi:hypothetical protein GF367_04955 [Candidatus Woesearchaeota archaeon]|nr:hypothetical protein [Candidatus Woesearchaeota archaeon]
MPKQPRIKRGHIIITAIIVSIILYLAGVMTGLNANKVVEQQVEVDIDELKAVLDDSALDLKNIQLQQFFIDNFPETDRCALIDIYSEHLYDQISSYWQVLPQRLEAYDKHSRKSDDYVALKREYIRLSLRFWLTTMTSYNKCGDKDLIGILYFYTPGCDGCVRQGEAFDEFQLSLQQEKDIIIFPIDATFPDDTVTMLTTFYGITEYPATVLHGDVVQGEIVTAQQLLQRYD